MNIVKMVLKHEVNEAMGCTESGAIAYAGSIAISSLKNSGFSVNNNIKNINVIVSPGILKNGNCVSIPNTNGGKGNALAAALGVLINAPEKKLRVLSMAKDFLSEAYSLIKNNQVNVTCNNSVCFHIIFKIQLKSNHCAEVTIFRNHLNVTDVKVDEQHYDSEYISQTIFKGSNTSYRDNLKSLKISDLIEISKKIDDNDRDYIKKGIQMNRKLAQAGTKLNKLGKVLFNLQIKGHLSKDVITSTEILVAYATDARMYGVSLPAMSSGSSGNQGIVATLVPYNYGLKTNKSKEIIEESIVLSHLLNAYVKCFTGDIAPICGCSIAAGVGATSAIVYQEGGSFKIIAKAINNLISAISGILCDGAKASCANKVAITANSVITSALIALEGVDIGEEDGFIGKTAEETIQCLGQISISMESVDPVIIGIMEKKSHNNHCKIY